MRALCRLDPERSEKVRLQLASLLVRERESPTEARRQLRQIRDGALDANLERYRDKLLTEAEPMIEDGVLEVEEDA